MQKFFHRTYSGTKWRKNSVSVTHKKLIIKKSTKIQMNLRKIYFP